MVLCFVQFKDVPLDAMPRLYLATPGDVAQRLRDSAKGRGDTILYELHKWGPRARGSGTIEQIPVCWRFSCERVSELFRAI